MKDITKIDKNFAANTSFQKNDIVFLSIDEAPIKIYGIFKENGSYRRLPESVAKTVSDGVYELHVKSAGGRVRFMTDSKYVAIRVKLKGTTPVPHGAFTGSAGFDIYSGTKYIKTFIPPIDMTDGYESIAEFGSNELRDITINFPRYSEILEMYIGIQNSAAIKEPIPYKNSKPIVYYGSSITQGGCASRPGMTYQNIVSRRLNLDFINLGFSGNAKGEDEIANYIKKLDMSLFVYDYDHNAPTPEHLRATHERMFKIIRSANPDLPIIIMPRPKYILDEVECEHLEVVRKTYDNAAASGDKNVYFISNTELTKLCKDEGTVDNCHPTDYGFVSMADAVCEMIERISIF